VGQGVDIKKIMSSMSWKKKGRTKTEKDERRRRKRGNRMVSLRPNRGKKKI